MASSSVTRETGFRALFSFHAPSSLFPPSAIISLTDDNSTFFLARPAQFGPLLPSDSLSGQLWVGSGFGDDSLVRGDAFVKAEGELGCSDIPGWSEGRDRYTSEQTDGGSSASRESSTKPQPRTSIRGTQARSDMSGQPGSSKKNVLEAAPRENDGTDDHLHYPLQGVPLAKGRRSGQEQSLAIKDYSEHADIQSLQESAEIAGKVVLLSRGGCGFLEKVKWAQKRGGVAVIVGDNVRGGQLISMYARGDTSNVTIPSLFTSQTTAHLLSSLIPPDSAKDGTTLDSNGKVEDKQNQGAVKKQKVDGTTFTPVVSQPKVTAAPRLHRLPLSKEESSSRVSGSREKVSTQSSWLKRMASKLGLGSRTNQLGPTTDSRRPPSSGRIKWMVSDDWNDEPLTDTLSKPGQSGSAQELTGDKSKLATGRDSWQISGDDFVIGVQDWRDPDLVGPGDQNRGNGKAGIKKEGFEAKASKTSIQASRQTNEGLSGGSRAPGSGVYGNPTRKTKPQDQKETSKSAEKKNIAVTHSTGDGQWWFSSLFGASRLDDDRAIANEKAKDVYAKKIAPHYVEDHDFKDGISNAPADHEGLWVTMTPTRMSTTPFFDTLLVLVVSPLVTLTVVYALLLIRSRIRRRRWRAPKSVVERLPVRTYHTMSYSSSSTSSQTSSPNSSSPTSPLLSSETKSGLSRPRPRSRTLSNLRQDATNSLDRATARLTLTSFPKKKYSGRQVECVVCLEEYVDGQSRVMSLPCGHEFHADCM